MKTTAVVVLVCGLGSLAGCGSDNGGKPGGKPDAAVDARADVPVDSGTGAMVDAGIMPPPVLDPNGTYGGKTYPEWLAAWWKRLLELPDATDVLADTYCGQSVALDDGGTQAGVFFLGGLGQGTGKFTLNCAVPAGEMIYVPLHVAIWDNAGVPEGNATDEQLKAGIRSTIASLTGLSLEIDGMSYGSKLADFAAYLSEPTQFSYTVPDTPTSAAAVTGMWGSPTFSGTVPKSFCGGYAVLLAPLSAGSHTIHVVRGFDSTVNEYTINLTVSDTGTLGPIDGGPSVDAAPPVDYCTGPASGALIDDMSGPSISLAPPSCGSPGNWTAWSIAPGTLTVPAGGPAVLSDCGSLCQSLYSPLPAGFFGIVDSFDGGTIDGGPASPQAMCIAGQTSPKQYDWSGLTLAFAYSGAPPSGTGPRKISSPSFGFTTDPPPALLDASGYSGIEFWLWASADTAAAMSKGFVVQLVDKQQLPGGGVCDANATTGKKPCHGASAGISFSAAAASEGTGLLLGADGFELTALAPGWQLVRAPWSSFLANPNYGGGNEKSVDPTTLAFAQFVIEQTGANGPAIPFDFCVYGLSFYK
jgi:hypothetical protein